jgi:hypothetical protein
LPVNTLSNAITPNGSTKKSKKNSPAGATSHAIGEMRIAASGLFRKFAIGPVSVVVSKGWSLSVLREKG